MAQNPEAILEKIDKFDYIQIKTIEWGGEMPLKI